MKHYRLDPKKPRQLTAAEVQRLDATPIDYSDIPPLGEEFFTKATEAWPPTKQQLTIRLHRCAQMAEGPRQRLPDPHQSHFASRNGEPAAAPITFDACPEKEYPIARRLKRA
jgi:hypothetical protein